MIHDKEAKNLQVKNDALDRMIIDTVDGGKGEMHSTGRVMRLTLPSTQELESSVGTAINELESARRRVLNRTGRSRLPFDPTILDQSVLSNEARRRIGNFISGLNDYWRDLSDQDRRTNELEGAPTDDPNARVYWATFRYRYRAWTGEYTVPGTGSGGNWRPTNPALRDDIEKGRRTIPGFYVLDTITVTGPRFKIIASSGGVVVQLVRQSGNVAAFGYSSSTFTPQRFTRSSQVNFSSNRTTTNQIGAYWSRDPGRGFPIGDGRSGSFILTGIGERFNYVPVIGEGANNTPTNEVGFFRITATINARGVYQYSYGSLLIYDSNGDVEPTYEPDSRPKSIAELFLDNVRNVQEITNNQVDNAALNLAGTALVNYGVRPLSSTIASIISPFTVPIGGGGVMTTTSILQNLSIYRAIQGGIRIIPAAGQVASVIQLSAPYAEQERREASITYRTEPKISRYNFRVARERDRIFEQSRINSIVTSGTLSDRAKARRIAGYNRELDRRANQNIRDRYGPPPTTLTDPNLGDIGATGIPFNM